MLLLPQKDRLEKDLVLRPLQILNAARHLLGSSALTDATLHVGPVDVFHQPPLNNLSRSF